MDLSVDNLSLTVDNKTILSKIYFALPQNKVSVILGKNGAGKSSLLKCCSKVTSAYTGKILFNKKNIKNTPSQDLAKKIAWCPESMALCFNFPVLDFVTLGRFPWHLGSPQNEDRLKSEQTLRDLKIDHLKYKNYLNLSSGEKKLAIIAHTLVGEQKMLLFDEPTANLDLRNSLKIISLFKKMKKVGKTICFTTHNIHLALKYSDYILVLHNGKILTHANKEEIDLSIVEKAFQVSLKTLKLKNNFFFDYETNLRT